MEIESEQEPNVGVTEALGEHASFPVNPRTTGEVIFGLGREFTVSSDEMRVKAAFEGWVRKNAKRAIHEAEQEDGPDEADRMRSAYMSDYGAGHYNWGGKYIIKARNDWPGVYQFLYLLLKRCHPDITEGMVKALMEENVAGCALAIKWAEGNWRAPALPGAKKANANGTTNGTAKT